MFREKQKKERREQGGSIFMVITFMAVCPIPLPDGFSYLLSFFSFIISYSFSCFSSSGFLFHPLSSSPSLYRLVAHFGLAGASSIQQQLEEIQSSRVATPVENPLHFALSPVFNRKTVTRTRMSSWTGIWFLHRSPAYLTHSNVRKYLKKNKIPFVFVLVVVNIVVFLGQHLGYWVVAVLGSLFSSSVCEPSPMLCLVFVLFCPAVPWLLCLPL